MPLPLQRVRQFLGAEMALERHSRFAVLVDHAVIIAQMAFQAQLHRESLPADEANVVAGAVVVEVIAVEIESFLGLEFLRALFARKIVVEVDLDAVLYHDAVVNGGFRTLQTLPNLPSAFHVIIGLSW